MLIDAESLGIGLDYPTCLALDIYELVPRQQVSLTISEDIVNSTASFRKEEEIITLSRKQLDHVLHGLLLFYALIHTALRAHRHFYYSMFLHGLDNHPGTLWGHRESSIDNCCLAES